MIDLKVTVIRGDITKASCDKLKNKNSSYFSLQKTMTKETNICHCNRNTNLLKAPVMKYDTEQFKKHKLEV